MAKTCVANHSGVGLSNKLLALVSSTFVVMVWLAFTATLAGASSLSDQRVYRLRVSEVNTPRPSSLPCVDVEGRVPQVSGRGLNLRAVNAAIRRAVLDDIRAFASSTEVCRPTNLTQSTRRTLGLN